MKIGKNLKSQLIHIMYLYFDLYGANDSFSEYGWLTTNKLLVTMHHQSNSSANQEQAKNFKTVEKVLF